MKKAKSKSLIGRPAGRKPMLNLRIEPVLHDRLKQSSEQRGSTLSEETVRRIEHTFDREDLLTEVLTLTVGKEMAHLLSGEMPLLAELAEASGTVREVCFYRDESGALHTRKSAGRKDTENLK
jgi:hypothetical protein